MLKLSKKRNFLSFTLKYFIPYFVAFFRLPGVAFSNSSMSSFSFNPGAKQFSLAAIALEGKSFSSFFKFQLTRTLTIFVDYGLSAHIP